ncbi:MAG: mevalonate kinase [Bacteroidetes bacterium]|nr:mevalonate kinase [Bacteroidota bacterium]
MSKKKDVNFHSKILLFGEYSIIQESMGLTLPYDIFKGKLTFDQAKEQCPVEFANSNQNLFKFLKHLRTLQTSDAFPVKLDLDKFEEELNAGLYFDSTIPQGFGIGSSGALVAAIYDRYAEDKIMITEDLTKENISFLKKIFGQMESFFHGTSSGVDPLICYINLPLLIRSKEDIEPVKVAPKANGKGAIFLIDTGTPRKTEPLVKYYMEKMEEGTFREFVDKQLKPFTNNCIQAFLNGDHATLFGHITKLSEFQFKHFKPMIPKLFNRLWKKGLDSGEYYLKLCGAGGGGFILGFTENFEKTQEELKGYQLKLVCHI